MADRAASIHSMTLSDQLTRALARRIVNGEIGEDSRPPTERDICDEFGVSRTMTREVIRLLGAPRSHSSTENGG